MCAKQQAVVTVSFGAPPKVEQENKILGFSDQLVFAGRPGWQGIIDWGGFLSLKSHSGMILLILICLFCRSPSKQSGNFLGALNAFNFIFTVYIHFS